MNIPKEFYYFVGVLVVSNLATLMGLVWSSMKVSFKLGAYHNDFEQMKVQQSKMINDVGEIKIIITGQAKDVNAAHEKIREIVKRIPVV